MARKRIKTLATEWGVSVDEVLQSCARLRLGHAHSDSSLLSQEESDRVKADLDEQAHRAAVLRRETVVETSAGKIVEKRLNATVMRRRHAEPVSGSTTPEEPFHFEVEKSVEEPFVAPFLEPAAPAAEPAAFFEQPETVSPSEGSEPAEVPPAVQEKVPEGPAPISVSPGAAREPARSEPKPPPRAI